ncbi:MAG: hypothetical protein MJ033_07615, partial [Victivallaceae bacterium]|nr:hypothetical protein [Victivallaceae bacterium]
NVTADEAFFAGCRGGYAAVPESVMCEIAAQSGCSSVLSKPENQGKLAYFMSTTEAESLAPVLPGDRLKIKFSNLEFKSSFGKCGGVLSVDGRDVFRCSLMFAVVDA